VILADAYVEETQMEQQTRPEAAPSVPFTGCCPPFDPTPWNDRKVVWSEKLFVTDRVRCLFHVPLNMGARVTQNQRLIDAVNAAPEQLLMLSDEHSPWAADLYIAVTRSVPGARMATLSGTFLTKVYEGPFRDAGKWAADMQQHVALKQQELEKLYFGYTTCPRCAKAYGKNYVVLFAKIHEAAGPALAAAS
jgi:hypothetical protein